jgi:hypothetical protein
MSGSFQAPGPAKRASPTVLSRHSSTEFQLAWMSSVVRQLLPTCAPGGNAASDWHHDDVQHCICIVCAT